MLRIFDDIILFSGRKFFLLLFLLFFTVLILIHTTFFYRGPWLSDDSKSYDQIAINLLEHNVFTEAGIDRAQSREPVYPLFLSGVYGLVGHRPRAALIAQMVFLAMALAAMSVLASKVVGRRYGALIGLVAFLIPGIAAQAAGSILTEVLAASFLIWGFVILRLGIDDAPSSWRYAVTGLLLGAAALTRFAFLLLVPILVLALIIFGKRLRIFTYLRQSIKPLLFLSAMFLFPILLWSARNYYAEGIFSPTGGKGGIEFASRADKLQFRGKKFFQYLYGAAMGDYLARRQFSNYEDVIEPHVYGAPARIRYGITQNPGLTEKARDEMAKTYALSAVRAQPFLYFAGSVAEFFKFNSPMRWYNAADTFHLFAGTRPEFPEWFKVGFTLIFRLSFYAFVGFVFYGVVRFGLKNPYLFFPSLTILYLNVVYMLLDAYPRHAIPIYPFYALLAVWGVWKFFNTEKAINPVRNTISNGINVNNQKSALPS